MACCTGFVARVTVFVLVSPTCAFGGSISPPALLLELLLLLVLGIGVANSAKSEKLEV